MLRVVHVDELLAFLRGSKKMLRHLDLRWCRAHMQQRYLLVPIVRWFQMRRSPNHRGGHLPLERA